MRILIFEVKSPNPPPGEDPQGEGAPGGGVGGFEYINKNSHPNRVYTPSLSLIALKMWPQPTYPQNIAPLPQRAPKGGRWGDLTPKIEIQTKIGFTHQV